jgi:Tol biopolymer transport system component
MYIERPAAVVGGNELWVSDIDGRNKVKITTGEGIGTGTWAPDNFHISFVEFGTSTGDKAYVVASDGSGLRQLPPIGDAPLPLGWSPDRKTLYVTTSDGAIPTVWRVNAEGSNPEKLLEDCGLVTDVDPGGKYLLAEVISGEKPGIYEVSISDRKCIPLLPGVVTNEPLFALDGKSFLYAVISRGEVTIYRQLWKNGKNTGAPQVTSRVPFAVPENYNGNTYDFSRDLSTFVYVRLGGHADLYLLSQE